MKKKSISILLALAMVISLLASCGTGSTSTSGDASTPGATSGTSSGSTSSTPVTPAEPKVLKVDGSIPITLNPHTASGTNGTNLVHFYGLLYYWFPKEDGSGVAAEPAMAAAEPIDVNGDGLVWNIPVRDGLTWDNGDPITAETYEYSFKMCLEPMRLGPYAANMASNNVTIKNAKDYSAGKVEWKDVGIKALDKKTLQITLATSATALDVMRHFISFWNAPVHEELYEKCLSADRTTSTYGTSLELTHFSGAFIMETWVDGNTVVGVRNEAYPRADAIKLDKIIYQNVDDAAGIQMLEKGEIDYVGLSSDTAEAYFEDPRFLRSESRYIRHLDFCDSNTDYPILANANFKKAVFYAIDRQAVTKVTGCLPANFAVPYTVNASADGTLFRNLPEAQKQLADNYGYNPELAKQYFDKALKEVGLTSVELELLYTTSAKNTPIATYLQEQFNKVFEGKFKLNITGMTDKARLELVKSTGTNPKAYQMTLGAWAFQATDFNPAKIFETFTSTYARRNAPYHSDKLDALWAEAQKPENAKDLNKLTQIALQMEKVYLDEVICVPVSQDVDFALCAEKVILALERSNPSTGWALIYADIAQ